MVSENPSNVYMEVEQNGISVRISVWAQEKMPEDKGAADFAEVFRRAWFFPQDGVATVERQAVGSATAFLVTSQAEDLNKAQAAIDLDSDHYLYASAEHDIEGTAVLEVRSFLLSLLGGLELLGGYAEAIQQHVGKYKPVAQSTDGIIDCDRFQLPAPSGLVSATPTPSYLILMLNHGGCDVQVQMYVSPKTPNEQQYPSFSALFPNLGFVAANAEGQIEELTVDGLPAGTAFAVAHNFLNFTAAVEVDENSYLAITANGAVADGTDLESLKQYLTDIVASLQFGEGDGAFQYDSDDWDEDDDYDYDDEDDWNDEEEEEEDPGVR